MICPPCRTAGNFIAALDYSPPTGSDLGNILELYARCKGGTWCDRSPEFPETLNA